MQIPACRNSVPAPTSERKNDLHNDHHQHSPDNLRIRAMSHDFVKASPSRSQRGKTARYGQRDAVQQKLRAKSGDERGNLEPDRDNPIEQANQSGDKQPCNKAHPQGKPAWLTKYMMNGASAN